MPRRFFNPTYWGKRGAGLAFFCPADGSILLIKRSLLVTEPGTWAFPGGRIEPGEAPLEAAVRETNEELGSTPESHPVYAAVFRDLDFEYTTFFVPISRAVKVRWTPTIVLNWENDEVGWFHLDRLPKPLHFGVEHLKNVLAELVG